MVYRADQKYTYVAHRMNFNIYWEIFLLPQFKKRDQKRWKMRFSRIFHAKKCKDTADIVNPVYLKLCSGEFWWSSSIAIILAVSGLMHV